MEEFDSGAQPLEGASTSTAGFIGLAQRGEIEGVPQLVTSVADFHRLFGSYLSENEFGEYRFLSYAVEHFYLNGGSRCYVMRVAPTDAKVATNKAATNKESRFWRLLPRTRNMGEPSSYRGRSIKQS